MMERPCRSATPNSRKAGDVLTNGTSNLEGSNRQISDHLRESATGAIGGIRQTKIFKDLQESLLLIEKTNMFPCPIGLTEKAFADN